VVRVNGGEAVSHAFVGRDIDSDVYATGWWRRRRLAVEAHDVREASDESPHHGLAD
jgi:hypothetical protein